MILKEITANKRGLENIQNPPSLPMEGNVNSEGRRGVQKVAISEGVMRGWLLSGKWLKVNIQWLSLRFRSVQIFICDIFGEMFWLNLQSFEWWRHVGDRIFSWHTRVQDFVFPELRIIRHERLFLVLRIFLARYFFPRNQSAEHFILKSVIPPSNAKWSALYQPVAFLKFSLPSPCC